MLSHLDDFHLNDPGTEPVENYVSHQMFQAKSARMLKKILVLALSEAHSVKKVSYRN